MADVTAGDPGPFAINYNRSQAEIQKAVQEVQEGILLVRKGMKLINGEEEGGSIGAELVSEGKQLIKGTERK